MQGSMLFTDGMEKRHANDNLPILIRHPRLQSRASADDKRQEKDNRNEYPWQDDDRSPKQRGSEIETKFLNKRRDGIAAPQVRPIQTGKALVG